MCSQSGGFIGDAPEPIVELCTAIPALISFLDPAPKLLTLERCRQQDILTTRIENRFKFTFLWALCRAFCSY